VPFTGGCCLPGGYSHLESSLLKYLKWLSDAAVTLRCRQNRPGGLEHPTGGVAERWVRSVPQDTDLHPSSGRRQELRTHFQRHPSEIPAASVAILFLLSAE